MFSVIFPRNQSKKKRRIVWGYSFHSTPLLLLSYLQRTATVLFCQYTSKPTRAPMPMMEKGPTFLK